MGLIEGLLSSMVFDRRKRGKASINIPNGFRLDLNFIVKHY